MDLMQRRNMLMRSGNAIDYESIARCMLFEPVEADIVLSADVTSIVANQFSGRRIRSFTSTALSGAFQQSFNVCRYLQRVTLNEGITKINQSCFRIDTTTYINNIIVDLPSTIRLISNYCFYNTINASVGDKVFTIILRAVTPPSLLTPGMSSVLDIYVPDTSVEAYKAENNWSALADRIFPISKLNT